MDGGVIGAVAASAVRGSGTGFHLSSAGDFVILDGLLNMVPSFSSSIAWGLKRMFLGLPWWHSG